MLDRFSQSDLFSDEVQLIKKRDLPNWHNAIKRTQELERMVADMQAELEMSKDEGFRLGYDKGLAAGREMALSELLSIKEQTAKELIHTESLLIGMVNSIVQTLFGDMTDNERIIAAVSAYFENSWSGVSATIYVHPSKVNLLTEYIYQAKPALEEVLSIYPDSELRSDQIEFEDGNTRFDLSLSNHLNSVMRDVSSALIQAES